MISSYNSLKDLISQKLNDNAYDVLFDVSLYNSKKVVYEIKEDNDDGVTVDTKRIVPTNISEIVGTYINIPNISVTENAIALEFDLFLGNYTEVPYQEQEKFKSVSYLETLESINNFRKELLAKVFQLGNTGLMFGGTDSYASFSYTTPFDWKTIYMKLDIRTNDAETILSTKRTIVLVDSDLTITKDDTNIILTIDNAVVSNTVEVPYTIGVNEIYVYQDSDGYWNLKVGSVTEKSSNIINLFAFDDGTISSSKDFNGVLYQLLISESVIDATDITNGLESAISDIEINFKDFDSRYTLNQEGSYTLLTNPVSNCVLWGDEGNVIFGFETLVPISDIRWLDGYPYQMFGLSISSLISKDVLFGNHTDYFLDGNQIFPIDRQHTYGTQLGTAQYIESLYATSIVEENAKDMAQTFFYTPKKQLTNLIKQISSNSQTQNQSFELVVKYPFFQETYYVVIDSGGIGGNINQLSTFTVTYKQIDTNLE